MQFTSLQYAIFLPAIFSIYWMSAPKQRWIFLLLASYYFYMCWNVKYLLLIVLVTVISYFCALKLEQCATLQGKRICIAITLTACLGILLFFKYFNFFSKSISQGLAFLAIPVPALTLHILLPVGISFYTFQTLSYVIDVYQRKVKAEHHFGYYATFVSFFPQLVAGPIERTANLLPQIREARTFSSEQAEYGLKLMAWGYFKKIAIADNLAIYVDMVYADLPSYKGGAMLIAIVFFALQIYCDFSGYSDIAIGTARLFGIQLMTNFKSPYFSASIKEFWSRWHISLSTWFRDYIYIPLGGNRVSKVRHAINLLLTFLLSGLWHGANWTFVLWGGIHGTLQVAESEILPRQHEKKTGHRGILWWLRVILVFAVVCIAWVFFRAKTLSDAVYLLAHCLDGILAPASYLYRGMNTLGLSAKVTLKLGISVICLFAYDYISLRHDIIMESRRLPKLLRWSIYFCLLFLTWAFYPIGTNQTFIYFQF